MFTKSFFLILTALPSFALAGNSNEDCALKRHFLSDLSGISRALCSQAIDAYKEGRQTEGNVRTICGNTHNVAWHKGRDNSMVDAADRAGKSMMVLSNKNGKSMATQVCPGVFLTTAHGLLNTPASAKKNGRPVNDIANQRTRLYAFPMTPKQALTDKDLNFEYISPMLEDEKNWEQSHLDYAFIKVDPDQAESSAKAKGFDYSSENFITPLNHQDNELVEASKSGDLEVRLYRGKSLYKMGDDGFPVRDQSGNFDENHFFNNRQSFATLDKPQMVKEPCNLSENGPFFRNDCPTEKTVSGSSYVTMVNNKPYLVGLHAKGTNNVLESTKDNPNAQFGAAGIKTSQFCEDYQKACGEPCPSLNETLPQQSGISI